MMREKQTRDECLEILVTLMGQGYAGLDEHDDARFVVIGPEPFLTEGENACEDLDAYFLSTAPLGVKPKHHAVFLRSADYLALGLDARDAPRVEVPYVSRRVTTELPA